MIYFEAAEKVQKLTGILWHKLTPVLFGNAVEWNLGTEYILASLFVPNESGLLVFRTECYSTNTTSGAADFMSRKTTPPGEAWWMTGDDLTVTSDNRNDQTDRANDAHIVLDVDNWLLFGPGQIAFLVGALDAIADIRTVRTSCYGFFIPSEIYEQFRNQFQQISGELV